MLARMSIGSKLITLPKFTPESYIKVLDENKVIVCLVQSVSTARSPSMTRIIGCLKFCHQVTTLMLVPPIVLFLSTTKLTNAKHLEHVTNIVSGAAPLSKSDVEKFYKKYQVDRNEVKFCQGKNGQYVKFSRWNTRARIINIPSHTIIGARFRMSRVWADRIVTSVSF